MAIPIVTAKSHKWFCRTMNTVLWLLVILLLPVLIVLTDEKSNNESIVLLESYFYHPKATEHPIDVK